MSAEHPLRRWDIFSHFSEEQLSQLGDCVERRCLEPNEIILREGEPTTGTYLIESGGVRIMRKTPYGMFALATLRPGHLFGETSFVDGNARSGDALTVAETELLAFNPEALAGLMERDQRFSVALYWSFWKSLSGKLRQTNEELTKFFSETGKPASSRPPPAAKDASGEFHIDLASKRKLFQEQRLSNLEINFLTSLSRERKFAPLQQIFREGEPGEEMYVVLEGRVMISKYIPGAGEEALAFLERGDYFGEMALIDNVQRSADAKASDSGAVVLAISRDVLAGILDIHRVSSLLLLKLLCTLVAGRLRELDDKIVGWFILAGGSATGWPVPDSAPRPQP
ncbi:MAG TPA: cyclic nucleotide-binding domain-containing protein [Thermoanaerobaculia bacterium]|nr:cyclic nucleotide-binding domain-containing protein [Thermoanaerobaculia bacterium]